MEIKYDYTKLKQRIKDKYGSYAAYAKEIGTTKSTLSLKLNNKFAFTQPEIEKSLPLLDIPRREIPDFYFSLLVEENDFNYSKIEGLVEIKEALSAQLEEGKEDVNPISLSWKYPQAMAYFTLETRAQDEGEELAKVYLEKFQNSPDAWESIMSQYEEERGGLL